MDRGKHPQVVRTWKFERIRKPATPKKVQQARPLKSRPSVTASRKQFVCGWSAQDIDEQKKVVNLTINIDEDRQFAIGHINFAGNTTAS